MKLAIDILERSAAHGDHNAPIHRQLAVELDDDDDNHAAQAQRDQADLEEATANECRAAIEQLRNPSASGATPSEADIKGRKAVRYILGRISKDPEIGYRMGHLTESYTLLCEAQAAIEGKTVDEIEDAYPPAQRS